MLLPLHPWWTTQKISTVLLNLSSNHYLSRRIAYNDAVILWAGEKQTFVFSASFKDWTEGHSTLRLASELLMNSATTSYQYNEGSIVQILKVFARLLSTAMFHRRMTESTVGLHLVMVWRLMFLHDPTSFTEWLISSRRITHTWKTNWWKPNEIIWSSVCELIWGGNSVRKISGRIIVTSE